MTIDHELPERLREAEAVCYEMQRNASHMTECYRKPKQSEILGPNIVIGSNTDLVERLRLSGLCFFAISVQSYRPAIPSDLL
jgi:hypothetical protein